MGLNDRLYCDQPVYSLLTTLSTPMSAPINEGNYELMMTK